MNKPRVDIFLKETEGEKVPQKIGSALLMLGVNSDLAILRLRVNIGEMISFTLCDLNSDRNLTSVLNSAKQGNDILVYSSSSGLDFMDEKESHVSGIIGLKMR